MIDIRCLHCPHPLLADHVEPERAVCTAEERRTGRCNDCKACHPPEHAPVREQVREEVPA